jgi:hypothetical protein
MDVVAYADPDALSKQLGSWTWFSIIHRRRSIVASLTVVAGIARRDGAATLIKPVDLQVPASSALPVTAADRRAEECRAGHQEKTSPASANRAFVEDDDYRS